MKTSMWFVCADASFVVLTRCFRIECSAILPPVAAVVVSSDDDVDDSGVASLPLRQRARVVSLEVQAVGKTRFLA